MARAEIVAIGDELTHGQCIDSNTAWLAQALEREGFAVARGHLVGDVEDDIAAVLADACARADVVVATGGLGPTLDDRTRDAAATAARQELLHDEAAWQQILAWFARIGRIQVPESNRRQAAIPRGADVLPNAAGSAPGFALAIGRATLFALPGVPSEMKAMFAAAVAPRLRPQPGADRPALAFATLQVLGPSEAALGERIAAFMAGGRNPAVGITASDGMMKVRIAAHGSAPAAAEQLCAQDVAALRTLLGEQVVADGDAPLQHVLVERLRQRGISVAVAESCTAGMLASALGDVPGVSTVLAGGVVAYANEVKVQELGVRPELLAIVGAVSEPVAAEMAQGVARRFGVRAAVAITGIAGPDGGSADKPVGTVCLATWLDGATASWTRRIPDLGRAFIRRRATLEAMAALLRLVR